MKEQLQRDSPHSSDLSQSTLSVPSKEVLLLLTKLEHQCGQSSRGIPSSSDPPNESHVMLESKPSSEGMLEVKLLP